MITRHKLKYTQENIDHMSLDYEYPNKADLHPGSTTSKELVTELTKIATEALTVPEHVQDHRKRVDDSMEAYVDLSQYEQSIKNKHTKRPVGLVVPLLYASHQTMMTYFSAAFLQHPYHKLRGLGGVSAVAKGALLERVLTHQHISFKTGLAIQTIISDALKYGTGVGTLEWRKHFGNSIVQQHVDEITELFMETPGIKAGDIVRMLEEEQVLYEGNKLVPIDTYQFFFDPYVNPSAYQDARFLGWRTRENVYDLYRREKDDEEDLFNCKALLYWVEQGHGLNDQYMVGGSSRGRRQGGQIETESKDGAVDIITIYADIIPEDWGLSDSDRPERWEFKIGGGKVIIRARKLRLKHNMWPVVAASPLDDGHSQMPISALFMMMGLEDTACWFLNTRFDNVAKTVNDMLIVNPHALEWDDIINPGPGKLVRLTQQFYYNKSSLDTFVKQLVTQDVTQGHINDFGLMAGLIKELGGTTDITQGIMQGMPERPTERGIDVAARGAMSRLQYMANRIGVQFLDDLGVQEAHNTQQFLGMDVIVETHGRDKEKIELEYGIGNDQIDVSPYDMDFPFMVYPHDNSMPGMENLQSITQVLQTMMGAEGAMAEIVQNTDISKLFVHWARIAGFEDAQEFIKDGGRMQPQIDVQPDQYVQEQAQAGNYAPVSELM